MRKLVFALVAALPAVMVASLGFAAAPHTFKAYLSGKQVVPSVMTQAKGEAVFKLEKDGTELAYTLKDTGIENVTSAHIHFGYKGKNGAPVINLFTGPKKEGKFSGVLSRGMITAKDLHGSLQGKTISDVVKMIKDGELYVNVHTDKYPDGEIRGQIR